MAAAWMAVTGRDGVEPARMQGMAAAEPANRQPAAPEGTEPSDRLHGVFRATGHEAAARSEQRADQSLVAAQQEDEETVDHGLVGGDGRGCRFRRGRV